VDSICSPGMPRRAFMATIAGSLLAAPLVTKAQQAGKVWRIGLFHVGLDHVPPSLDGLRDGLQALGYEEGKNLQLDFRNVADEAAARVVAVDLARGRPDLLVAFETHATRSILEFDSVRHCPSDQGQQNANVIALQHFRHG
jgi:hypothetical protein